MHEVLSKEALNGSTNNAISTPHRYTNAHTYSHTYSHTLTHTHTHNINATISLPPYFPLNTSTTKKGSVTARVDELMCVCVCVCVCVCMCLCVVGGTLAVWIGCVGG